MNRDIPTLGASSADQSSLSIPRFASPIDRMKQAIQANPWLDPNHFPTITNRISLENSSFRSKRSKLFKLANAVHDALQPYTTCGKGCSHCCSMRTLIYRFEAVTLARVSGKTMVELPYRSQAVVIELGRVAPPETCPFLMEGCCSVYDHRPMICRLHHSFNTAPGDCEVTANGTPRSGVAMYNPDFVEVPYHQLVRSHHAQEPWGAITEFFPA